MGSRGLLSSAFPSENSFKYPVCYALIWYMEPICPIGGGRGEETFFSKEILGIVLKILIDLFKSYLEMGGRGREFFWNRKWRVGGQ